MNAASCKPFRPPKISTAEQAFLNGVRGRRRRLSFELGGAIWSLRFTRSTPSTEGTCLHVTDGASHAWLRLADWNGMPSIGELSCNAFDSLPPEVQSIVADVAFASALDGLGGATGSAWKIAGVATWPTESAHMAGFELIDDVGRANKGAMALDAAAAEALVGLLDRVPTEPWRNLEHLPLDVRFLVGASSVSPEDFATLRGGDLLVIERLVSTSATPSHESVAVVAIVGDKLAFDATISDGSATLGSTVPMPTESRSDAVQVEIAGPRLQLGEARKLKSGSQLPLADSLDSVRVMRSGRVVEYGRLALCAGSLAIRLDLDAAIKERAQWPA